MKQSFNRCFIILSAGLFSCSNNSTLNSDTLFPEGEIVYQKSCVACHQADGKGVENVFPPLANSDYLLADKNRAIHQIIFGSSGEMTVNGKMYNTIMPPQGLSDIEVRDVMNYVLNAWGNNAGEVTLKEVEKVRTQQ